MDTQNDCYQWGARKGNGVSITGAPSREYTKDNKDIPESKKFPLGFAPQKDEEDE